MDVDTKDLQGDDSDDYDDAYDEELAWVEGEERMSNFGFTHDEVQELLAQGVKPWDDDAWVCISSSEHAACHHSYTAAPNI